MAPDRTCAFVGGPCCPTIDFVYGFIWISDRFNGLLSSTLDIIVMLFTELQNATYANKFGYIFTLVFK